MQEKYYRGRRLFIMLPIVTFLMGVLFTVPSLADGIHPQESNSGDVSDRSRLTSLPEMSYQALLKWLEEYQDAKPTFQPGQRLTAADQEALKPFIPLPAWEFYFYPEMDMEIAATGTYPPPQDWGKNRDEEYDLKEDGSLVGFTGGGFPFSKIKPEDPQAAVKVLWNMLWHPGSYDYLMPHVMWSRSPNGKLDREYQFISTSVEFAKGQYCLLPGYEEVRGKMLTEFRSPRDMAGTKNLQVSYIDPYKEENGWLYMPSERKPRRMLSSERTSESSLFADSIPEDSMGFNGRVYQHTWRYLGKKKVLATMNLATHPQAGGPHQWVPQGARWELRECHVIEQIPKDPKHPYSHKWIFIDAETFWTVWMLAYDQQKQILRIGQDFLKYSESYATEEALQPPYLKMDYSANVGHNLLIHIGQVSINVQKPHATYTHCYTVHKELSPGRTKQIFSLRNMASGRR